ncbi:metal ABC transporter solute-binding protein, Zn/Mn family [Rheinheimera sp.]|uniref:metal ABC transporter solute-binding protein, Zn/Mn family n=1 Tax=Rheinheimera sp. TaxID=1869214 RepID=UPI0040475D03
MRTAIKSVFTVLAISGAGAAQAFSIFVCEPEWGALVKALHPSAQVFSATTHLQDPHHIEARPSLIAQLRQADLAVCTGAGLEVGWLPMLQARSGNAKVQDGQPGMFYAAKFVKLIGQYEGVITPFSGDVHPEGNPHFHTDPRRLLQVALALRDRLIQLNPSEENSITAQHAQFSQALTDRLSGWEAKAARLKGKSVLTQHATFGYLWDWLSIKSIGDLEPKPGMPPTPKHLERLRAQMSQSTAQAIIIAQHHDKRPAQWLVQQQATGKTPLVILPATVPEVSSTVLLTWLDGLVVTLTQEIQ